MMDIDVVIPIWLNPHIFGCNEYEKVTSKEFDKMNILLDENYTICDHNRKYYSDILCKYLKDQKNVTGNCWSKNIHVSLSRNVLTDIWIFISEESVYRDISICKCDFCGLESYALEKTIEYSKKYYGNDCMTVHKRYKGKKITIFDNPNKKHTNSINR